MAVGLDNVPVATADKGLGRDIALRPVCVVGNDTHLLEGTIDGESFAVKFADKTEGYLLRHRGVSVRALVCTPLTAKMLERLPEKPKPDTSKLVISPMPGLVVSIDVEVGQEVEEGEAVCIVEAMKMQNIIRAEATGTVKTINVGAGDSVAADEVMVEFE